MMKVRVKLGLERGIDSGGAQVRIPRHEMPESWIEIAPAKMRGRRECRVQAAPMARLQKKAGGSHQRYCQNIRHSLRDGFNGCSALSPEYRAC
jgi:hypothetical protein